MVPLGQRRAARPLGPESEAIEFVDVLDAD
jgi:hypothetical protein